MLNQTLAKLAEELWLYAAAPLFVLAGLVLTVRLGFPQIRKLVAGFKATKESDEGAGDFSGLAAVVLDSVASLGALGVVGAATAVSLGGVGALAWLWLFSFLGAPLRMAETVLARTGPIGQAAGASLSLPNRLLKEDSVAARAMGFVLLALAVLVGLFFAGSTHGVAVVEAATGLVPAGAKTIVLVVAVVGAVLALIGPARGAKLAAALGGLALVLLIVACGLSIATNPGRGFGIFGRAILDMVQGAPQIDSFSGALAGEVATAALAYMLPALSSGAGVLSSLHARAATSTRGQAAAALLSGFGYVVVITIVGMAFAATGAFFKRIDDSRDLNGVHMYRGDGFETASQRLEDDRLWTGPVRIRNGEMRETDLSVATDRGLVSETRFTYYDKPADLMVRYEDGKPVQLERRMKGSDPRISALNEIPLAQTERVNVTGKMLPRGGSLVATTMANGVSGKGGAHVALAALLVLAALGAAAWGWALGSVVGSRFGSPVGTIASLLPAVGLVLAATCGCTWLSPLGLAAAALSVTISSVVLLTRSGEVAELA